MITVNSRFHTLIKAAGARTRARIYFIDNTVNCTNDTAVQTNGTLLKRNSTDTAIFHSSCEGKLGIALE